MAYEQQYVSASFSNSWGAQLHNYAAIWSYDQKIKVSLDQHSCVASAISLYLDAKNRVQIGAHIKLNGILLNLCCLLVRSL